MLNGLRVLCERLIVQPGVHKEHEENSTKNTTMNI